MSELNEMNDLYQDRFQKKWENKPGSI